MSVEVKDRAIKWIESQGYKVSCNRVISTETKKTIGWDVVVEKDSSKGTYKSMFLSTAVENAVRDLVSVSTLYAALGIIKEGE